MPKTQPPTSPVDTSVLFIETKATVFGGQKALLARCAELDKRGISYRIIHPFCESDFLKQYNQERLSGKIETPSHGLKKSGQVLFIVKSVLRALRRQAIHTIHCDAFDSAYIVAALRKLGFLRRVKLIFTVRSERYLRFNQIDRFLLKSFNQINTNSDYSRQKIEEFGGIPAHDIAVTGSPIDLDALPLLPPKGPFNKGDTISIGYVGSFDQRKRLDRFVDFGVALHRQYPDYKFRFLVYGEAKTSEQKNLQQDINNLIVQEEASSLFSFQGYGKPAEIAEKIDLLFCPFDNEPLGRVVPEFLFMGREVIAHNDGGLGEAGAGFTKLIQADDENGLRAAFVASAIEVIKNAPLSTAHIETVRTRLIQRFGREAVVGAEVQLYQLPSGKFPHT